MHFTCNSLQDTFYKYNISIVKSRTRHPWPSHCSPQARLFWLLCFQPPHKNGLCCAVNVARTIKMNRLYVKGNFKTIAKRPPNSGLRVRTDGLYSQYGTPFCTLLDFINDDHWLICVFSDASCRFAIPCFKHKRLFSTQTYSWFLWYQWSYYMGYFVTLPNANMVLQNCLELLIICIVCEPWLYTWQGASVWQTILYDSAINSIGKSQLSMVQAVFSVWTLWLH